MTDQKIYFECSPTDLSIITEIVNRGVEMGRTVGVEFDFITASMDLVAVHCNGTPLKLLQLLMSDNSDFALDFTGIGLNIDRKSGILLNGYKPIFAVEKH